MKKIHTFLLVLPLIISSCGQPFASTGQQGEAIVMGIATSSDGQPMANQMIKIADHEYIPNSYVSRSVKFQIDSVMTDVNGQFEYTVAPGQTVTLSSRKGSSFFYVPDITMGEKDINLGSIPFRQGMATKVYPWWKSKGEDQYLLVQGTDWVKKVRDDAISDISLPIGEFDIIRFDSEDIFKYNNSDNVGHIGDSASWKADPTFFGVWNKAEVDSKVTLILNDIYDEFAYAINWGDGSMVDTIYIDSTMIDTSGLDSSGIDTALIYTTSMTHTYREVNTYEVIVTEYELFQSDTLTIEWKLRRREQDSIEIVQAIDTLAEGVRWIE